jgi:hypothetical protein
MIHVGLQIGEGDRVDTFDAYGLVYIKSDTRYSAPIKAHETTVYAEQEGENIDPRTVDDAFDYTVEFVVEAKNGNVDNANAKIKAFNDLLYTRSGDVKTFKQVVFYNYHKKHKIVGYPEPIQEATNDDFFIHDKVKYDWCKVEWKIRVAKPSECDFSLDTSKI